MKNLRRTVALLLSFILVFASSTFCVSAESEVMPLANEEYLFNQNVYMETYSSLFTLSGSQLTSYYSVGESSEIDYVTIKIYRETSATATGRTLIASKQVNTGTSSTLFFRDKSIVAGANYRVHIIPNVITANSPTRVIVSLVSW